MGMTRERKLEAALREIISFANDYRRACIPEFVFLNRVLEITTGEALRALATPRTSEWNEAIEAAAEECDVFSRSIGARCAGVARQIAWDIRSLKRKEQS